MKQQKQRVIAIDYFRGLCILMVIVNHSWIFSMPYAYLTGAGGMWTSAAEMFFLLSGITMMIVRGLTIKQDFKPTSIKIWRRAGLIYLLYILSVTLSLCLIYLLPSQSTALTIGSQPSTHGAALLWQILSFQYTVGLAGFLMYYSVFLLCAPLLLYALLTRFWPLVLGLSLGIYMFTSLNVMTVSFATGFLTWQLYFILGLIIGRFRISGTRCFYGLSKEIIHRVSLVVYVFTIASIILASLLAFNVYPAINKLTNEGWIPEKFMGAYSHLLNHQLAINHLLRDNRLGLLRPAAAILFLVGSYLLYQKHRDFLLAKSGKFINSFGRDTLWIFASQALVIPVMAALPAPHNLYMNTLMTICLISSMWLITQRYRIINNLRTYFGQLQQAYYEAKYSYWYRSENDV